VEVLGESPHAEAAPVLLELAIGQGEEPLRKAALNALLIYDQDDIARRVGAAYASLPEALQPAAETLLSSRASWAALWLQGAEDGAWHPARVAGETVRRLRVMDDERVQALAKRLWVAEAPEEAEQLARERRRLAAVVHGGTGNPYPGRDLFQTACGACHTLFSQGGQIGPDLTSYQRQDVENMLHQILEPSAEIREGYENVMVETRDGRWLSGFVVERDPQILVLRGFDGQRVAVPRAEVKALTAAGRSLMPDGLLADWSDAQVRDFFAYLRSSQPLP
jgi:putative heme-binding domain-containing protein